MPGLLKDIDARARLAGTNKLEILLFSLGTDGASGRRETFGINVFKVREVMRTPPITRAPDMPEAVEGMVSLRGELVPVIHLARCAGFTPVEAPEIMMLTEYNGHTLGFLVESVDTILRVDWSAMRVPPEMINACAGGRITAVTELADGRLAMMIDVETILAAVLDGARDEPVPERLEAGVPEGRTVYFADDSAVARKQISRTLDSLGIRHLSAVNGKQAWQQLREIAASAAAAGRTVRDELHLIMTDVEMPEMDGYMLTKSIKSDPRFAGVPVIMHSSLSAPSNRQLGMSVGVDDYIAKLGPAHLARTLARLLAQERQ